MGMLGQMPSGMEKSKTTSLQPQPLVFSREALLHAMGKPGEEIVQTQTLIGESSPGIGQPMNEG